MGRGSGQNLPGLENTSTLLRNIDSDIGEDRRSGNFIMEISFPDDLGLVSQTNSIKTSNLIRYRRGELLGALQKYFIQFLSICCCFFRCHILPHQQLSHLISKTRVILRIITLVCKMVDPCAEYETLLESFAVTIICGVTKCRLSHRTKVQAGLHTLQEGVQCVPKGSKVEKGYKML